MKIINKNTYSLRALSALFLVTLLVAQIAYPAVSSAVTYGNTPGPANFQEIVPPTGLWTTTSTTAAEGRVASYTMPNLNICSAATINSLTVSMNVTGDVTPYTEGLSGVFTHVSNKNTGIVQTVTTVTSGTRMDGPISGSDPNLIQNIGRGITNSGFTTTAVSINGEIRYGLNTAGMTAADYNNLALQVQHDLRDGISGFITSLSSSQPVVTVSYDETPCPPVGGPAASTDKSVGAPNTGLEQQSLILPAVLFSLSLGMVIMARQYGKKKLQ